MTIPTTWPPRVSEDALTTAGLSSDGMTVRGWVRKPAGVWKPADLLWLPPTAVKSTDVDQAGTILDVTEGPGDHDWVTAQLNRRERYLDLIRAKVRAGAFRMTAALAKWLGLDEDGAELVERTGPLAYGKSYEEARRAVATGRSLAGFPIDRDTGLPIIGRA